MPAGRGYGDNSQEVISPGKLQKGHPILFEGPIEPGKTSQKKTTANKRKTILEKMSLGPFFLIKPLKKHHPWKWHLPHLTSKSDGLPPWIRHALGEPTAWLACGSTGLPKLPISVIGQQILRGFEVEWIFWRMIHFVKPISGIDGI